MKLIMIKIKLLIIISYNNKINNQNPNYILIKINSNN
jgi:hypothetical protein